MPLLIMIPRRIAVFMLLSCFFNISFSQDLLTLVAVKNHISSDNLEYSETLKMHKGPTISESKNTDFLQALFLNNLSIGVSYGISEFKGDIKESGFMNSANMGKLYNLSIYKNINNFFSVSSEMLFGNLKGSKRNEAYLISDDPPDPLYDPYDLNEGLGEKFTADYLEIDLITSINLERVFEHYYSRYRRYRYYDNNNFDIYFNIGFGMASFESIKRNIDSDSYIYAYGYDDQETTQNITERKESLFERPRAGVFCYGYSVTFSTDPKVSWRISLLERLVDTDFLDASFMNKNYDKFRSISLGLNYSL